MIPLTTMALQALGSALIAAFLVWSTYRTDRYAIPNNSWFKGLKVLPDRLNMGIRAFLVFAAMFAFGDLVWAAEPYIHRGYSFALYKVGIQGTQVAIGLTVIMLGLGAYWFKVKNQTVYGFVEIIFAGAVGVATAKQMTAAAQLTGPIAALIGAIYVVSRGAGNIADGWRKE